MKKEYYSWIVIAIGLVVLAVFASGVMNVAAFSKAKARIVEKVRLQKKLSPAQPPTPVVKEATTTETAPELQ
jgi:hypothetical protein